jgi:hypothetical protein
MLNIISGTCRTVQELQRPTEGNGVRSVDPIFISYIIRKVEEEENNLNDMKNKQQKIVRNKQCN